MASKTFKELSYRDKVAYVLCITGFVAGLGLCVAGMCIPPEGEISGSVLTALGMLLTFAGSVLGISLKYKTELEKIKSEVSNIKGE